MRSRIMYIEDKSGRLTGACRIGRVRFSKTGATLYYSGRSFQSLSGAGFKANYFDIENGDHFWISGPRRDGADGLYGRITQAEDVDADVSDIYWRDIREVTAPAPNTKSERAAEAFVQSQQRSNSPSIEGWGRKGSRMASILRQRRSSHRSSS